ncbi:hypothetical protein ACFWIY_16285 [Streptomyces sioyaensis]|uniref:hypothetical protein n=1 Tax=Streptomyces sioyaensis TaxID=67364 RepID=UPI0036696A85
MDMGHLAERISAIDISTPDPEPPAGTAPEAVWRVPVGVINIVSHAEIDLVRSVNDLHAESPGVLGLDAYLPEPAGEPLACPACQNSAELTLQGRWGDPATVLCQCGHAWPLAPSDEPGSTDALKRAIWRSVEENGMPPAPPA